MVVVAIYCGSLTFTHTNFVQNDLAMPLADIFTGARMVIVHLIREHKDSAVLYTTKLSIHRTLCFFRSCTST